MTGDGVNDAPSIKSADIGVGMGITGTDVTKNVADMVLTDDNFATIVGAVEEGRRIYDNIRKAIQFLLGSNMSEVLSIFSATILGFTILKPVHLLWINLVTDCFPALALGMEKAEPNIMRRKPRDAKSGIFADGMGYDIAYQGVLVTVLTLASYFVGHFMETGTWEMTNSAHGMTMAFLTMSMAEIFHSFNMRSQRQSIFKLGSHNKMLWIAAIGSLVATTLVCEVLDENNIEIKNPDLSKGYLKQDSLFIRHHDAIEGTAEVGHHEIVREYPNGGRDAEFESNSCRRKNPILFSRTGTELCKTKNSQKGNRIYQGWQYHYA